MCTQHVPLPRAYAACMCRVKMLQAGAHMCIFSAHIMHMYLPDAYLHSSMNMWNFISPLESLDILTMFQRWSAFITTSCIMGKKISPGFKAYRVYKVKLFVIFV